MTCPCERPLLGPRRTDGTLMETNINTAPQLIRQSNDTDLHVGSSAGHLSPAARLQLPVDTKLLCSKTLLSERSSDSLPSVCLKQLVFISSLTFLLISYQITTEAASHKEQVQTKLII